MQVIQNEEKENVRLSDEEVEVYAKKYLETFSRTEAYKAVHPNCTHESAVANGLRYFNYPKVRQYLAIMLQDKVMTTDEVLTQLASIARGGKKDSDRIRALELLGKTKALFLDRTDITSGGKEISWTDFIKPKDSTENSENEGETVE